MRQASALAAIAVLFLAACVTPPAQTPAAPEAGLGDCPPPEYSLDRFPWPVYDLERGDCALTGRQTEVRDYLAGLEAAVQRCRERTAAKHDEARAALSRLRDALMAAAPRVGEPPAVCRPASFPMRRSGPRGGAALDREGWEYTEQLRTATEQALAYCDLVDELAWPAASACRHLVDERACRSAPSTAEWNGVFSAVELQRYARDLAMLADDVPRALNATEQFYHVTVNRNLALARDSLVDGIRCPAANASS
jgi:hypothetical protein